MNISQEHKRSGIQVQSVARALSIIKCFQTASELGITEISEMLHLNKSTVFGLVNTLSGYGYLEQVRGSRKYRLGLALFELGHLVLSRMDICGEAKEACIPLAAKYQATVHIATHTEGEVVYLDKIDRGNSLVTISNVGKRLPMYCCGVGKAMLAFLSEEYLEKYIFNKPLKKITPNTVTQKDVLLKQLAQVKKSRIAFDREEIEEGLCCIASPILQRDGFPEIAISLSFPYGKIKKIDRKEAEEAVLACAAKLSARLGYHPPSSTPQKERF